MLDELEQAKDALHSAYLELERLAYKLEANGDHTYKSAMQVAMLCKSKHGDIAELFESFAERRQNILGGK